jgi:DNA polymerase-3 subunit chi
MTKVDFYILDSHQRSQRLHFCCRLIEKAQRQGNKIHVRTESRQESEELDDMLWSFKPESYVPHMIYTSEMDADELPPVLISHEAESDTHHDVYVNLPITMPNRFAHFKRFAHVVDQEESRLAASRKHYRYFKDNGYPVAINKLHIDGT